MPTVALFSQCPAGQMEITIEVLTDDWGNETYWQLVPFGNACNQAPIFIGGNTTALGCASGGTQTSPAGGYASNSTFTEGPWCLDEGVQYNIISIDSYGDGQATFRVRANGAVIGEFDEDGGFHIFTFLVQEPLALDMGVTALTTPLYNRIGLETRFSGVLRNFGSATVTDFTLNAALDGNVVFTQPYSGMSIGSGNSYEFLTTDAWMPASPGGTVLTVWASDLNGSADEDPSNDMATADLWVNDVIPDLVPAIIANGSEITIVADDDEDLLTPRDIAWHPDPARNEIWAINKDVPGTGGSTVRFFNPGEPNQAHLWQRDPSAGHFMSLPTGIAMGDNGNFATSPGIFDANQNGGDPFTGPTLWSADPNIYAFPGEGPLGSHLDMLHVNPRSQGIAHDRWNRYWVVDGHNGDVVMNDFREDHGPGNTWHGDAVIRRYGGVTIVRDPNDHIVSHCELDKRTGWLYVVDHGNQRILRLDTRSGSVNGPASFGPWESYVEYTQMSGHIWETIITTGLVQPAGIAISGDHLLVSDHANGDIVIFDISEGGSFAELGRIQTGAAGIMGIEVGPDGRIWFVNATTHALGVIGVDENVGIAVAPAAQLRAYPNPANDRIFITEAQRLSPATPISLRDAAGRIAMQSTAGAAVNGIDVSALAPGAYALELAGGATRIVIAR
ncbi:MAG: T9SS type A sorting domain-containing protein [Flavobacteriales bacterium]|nr:T9SS type A sorting domain-containing protein [Flavobacteriales bacterium]